MTSVLEQRPSVRARSRNLPAHSAATGGPAYGPLLLAFLWPGLGHLARRRLGRGLAFAVPPALLAAVLVVALQNTAMLAVALLSPTTAVVVIALVALDAAWRVTAIADTWRSNSSLGRSSRVRGEAVAVVVLSAAVLVSHAAAATVVQSFADAGEQIFQGDRPTAGSPMDEILGGAPGDAAEPGDAGEPAGDVVDWNDDDWIEDEPGDHSDEPDSDTDAPPGPDSPGPNAPDDPTVTPPPLGAERPVADPKGNAPVNVLFVGLDSGLGRTHSLTDSLILASYDPADDRLTMISLPRDTGRLPLYTGGTYQPRVNTFLSYARRNPQLFPEGPVAALMREVGYVLGTDVHYYAATNLEGLPRVVDLVGGVTVTLDRPIADPKWNLFLSPGVHYLDGETVMPFVRSRYGPGNSDWQRARRQQQVLRALAERVRDPAIALRLPAIIDGMSTVVRTNVPRERVPMLLRILERANDASAEHIVLSPNTYATRIPVAETGGRYMTELKMSAVRRLSLRVFGAYSRYK